MDTKLLETFVAVAEERHFGMAASRLHLTQPAVSQHVRKLEKDLGTELFERHPRGVRLTDAGMRLLEKARTILAGVADLRSSVDGKHASLRGRLRIGYSGYNVVNYLPRLLRRLQEEHPAVTVGLTSGLHGGLAPKAVLDGSLDFAFSRDLHHGLHVGSHVYAVDEVLIAVAEDHPLAGRTSVTIADIMDEPFITYPFVSDEMVRTVISGMVQNAGGVFSVRYSVADTPMMMALVAEGLGIAQVFSSVLPSPVAGVSLMRLEGMEPFNNTLIWNSSRAAEPLHAELIRIIRDTF